MGRILGSNIRNVLSILDTVSGKEIDLYYRMPTTSERIAYESAKFAVDKDGTIKNRAIDACQEHGLLILEGFKKGSFHLQLDDGSLKDISSDLLDPDYLPDWKERIKEQAADLAMVLGKRIFDSPLYIVNQESQRKN